MSKSRSPSSSSSFLESLGESPATSHGGHYIITDSTISRSLLYQKLNKTDKVFIEYSYYDDNVNEFMLANAVLNAVGSEHIYYCEYGFPGFKNSRKDDDWDEGHYLFVIERSDKVKEVIHKKGNSVNFISDSLAAVKKLRDFYTKKINLEILKLTKKVELNNKISLLMKGDSYYFNRVDINIDNVSNLDLDLHYGTGFAAKSDIILNNLKTNHKGIYLIHGKIGSGKTTYLRYLVSRIFDKRVIFIPPYFTDFLSSPEFLPTLVSDSGAKNSILIIEDAEKVVKSREDSGNDTGSTSNLINLTDGILADSCQLQVICTFNTKVENIDRALLRKGRLVATHTFDALSISDSQRLVDKLAAEGKIKHFQVKKEMTLAEIYGAEQDNFHEEKEERRIGFGR